MNEKKYKKMTVRELRDEVMKTGTNPLGMTKARMIDFLVNTDKAKSMTPAELYKYLVENGLA